MLLGLIILIIITLILVIIVLIYFCNSVLFWPSTKINKYPDCENDYRDIYISTEDPHRIYNADEIRYEECINVWFFPNFSNKRRGHCKTTVLYFHGNSGNISHRNYVIDICRRFNLNLLLVDYRGYGKSDGTPSATGIYQDGETAYHFLTGHVDCDNIIIWGESLGGTVACHVASKYKCRALILLATFSCLEDVIDDMVEPWILSRSFGLVVNRFFHPMNSKEYIKNIRCPVVIMHSKEDSLIPYRCSHILYNSISHKRKVLFTINGDHSSPKIGDEILKQMFAFVGIQAECMDHHINHVKEILADITNDNPGIMPENKIFGTNI